MTYPTCCAWRHPKPKGANGRCIGRTDLCVDRRKAKRLAHRIRQAARRHNWPRVIYTSPLRRCADVGRQLKRWGWRHHMDVALSEMDFGIWDGQPWSAINTAQVDAWVADFMDCAPGGGEDLRALFQRVAAWRAACQQEAGADAPRLLVAHAGWMLAHQWLCTQTALPTDAAQWPVAPGYGVCWRMQAHALASQ
ncbi:MAG: histidine phosphatase family protein [Aquabacterium sp.]|nr:histidine phosphatase family protein [Aquabacterium sp.]